MCRRGACHRRERDGKVTSPGMRQKGHTERKKEKGLEALGEKNSNQQPPHSFIPIMSKCSSKLALSHVSHTHATQTHAHAHTSTHNCASFQWYLGTHLANR